MRTRALIWGAVWTFQGYAQKQQESIAAGVSEGLRFARAQQRSGVSVDEGVVAAPPEVQPAAALPEVAPMDVGSAEAGAQPEDPEYEILEEEEDAGVGKDSRKSELSSGE